MAQVGWVPAPDLPGRSTCLPLICLQFVPSATRGDDPMLLSLQQTRPTSLSCSKVRVYAHVRIVSPRASALPC